MAGKGLCWQGGAACCVHSETERPTGGEWEGRSGGEWEGRTGGEWEGRSSGDGKLGLSGATEESPPAAAPTLGLPTISLFK